MTQDKQNSHQDNEAKSHAAANSLSAAGVSMPAVQMLKKENNTGLSDDLKSGIEHLSGYSMDDVKVHYNSDKPVQLNAYAFAQGSDIHIAPGQERHLPHEAWHVVQQKMGRVQPTRQFKQAVPINDDPALEKEADMMGQQAVTQRAVNAFSPTEGNLSGNDTELKKKAVNPGEMPVMRKLGFEYELSGITPKKNKNLTSLFKPTWKQMDKGEIIQDKGDYQITADLAAGNSNNLEFITRPFDENDPGELNEVDDVAESIKDDIEDITGEQKNTNLPLSRFKRITGPASIYIEVKESNPLGKIQMTGGVDLDRLAGIMSGEALGAVPPGRIENEEEAQRIVNLEKYYKIGFDDRMAMGIVYGYALTAVKQQFNSLRKYGQRMIAAIAALMAQVILENRQARQSIADRVEGGRFIAKTDYAMILQLASEKIGTKIDWNKFPIVVLNTVQRLVDKKSVLQHEGVPDLSLNSPIFPKHYSVGGNTFTELTIGQWVTAALPQGRKDEIIEIDEDFGYKTFTFYEKTGRKIPKGQDLLTSKNYPSSRWSTKHNEVRAFGTYGNKTDPGDKAILEWRDLSTVFPDYLPDAMVALFKYYSQI